MKQIIINLYDTDNRISINELQNIGNSIENYLYHDYPEYFEGDYDYPVNDIKIEIETKIQAEDLNHEVG